MDECKPLVVGVREKLAKAVKKGKGIAAGAYTRPLGSTCALSVG